jgi:hypothetical protein
MEDERIDYSYLNVRELKVVCKFFKLDIPARARRAELESLIILAQTQMAMATVEAYENFKACEPQEEESELVEQSNDLAKG